MAVMVRAASFEELAAAFSQALEASKYSTTRLAEKAAVSRTTISDFRAGRRLPTEMALYRIATALGMPEQQRDRLLREARVWRQADQARSGGRLQAHPGPFGQPDPLRAADPEQLQHVLGAVHLWAGKPSLRELERRSDGILRRSTISDMLRGKPARLPDYDRYLEFLRACGIEGPNLEIWVFIWRRLQAMESPELASWMPGVVPAVTAS
ncbi:helix-turn-helix domain-containing protein [Streptomyces salinarius]|uniref:Helix-turn-helix domain-containing protein n=1 Tax=Streptomyces salinarius TaxID=2762598 RepID=A0ABW8BMK3_9ACTN